MWRHGGLSVVSNYNYILNIGFGSVEATHPSSTPMFLKESYDKMPQGKVQHPKNISRNLNADLDRLSVKYRKNKYSLVINSLASKIKDIIRH